MDSDSDHLSAREVESYRNGTIGALARQRVDRHLAGCAICLDLVLDAEGPSLAVARLTEALLESDGTPFHMSAEDIASYVAGRLDEADRVVFESHLEICPECGVAPGAGGETTSTGPSEIPRADSRAWNWLLRRRSWPPPLATRYVAAIVALMIILVLAWAVWRSNRGTNQVQQGDSGERAGPAPAQQNAGPEAADGRSPTGTQTEESPQRPRLAVSLKDGDNSIGLDQQGKLVGIGGLAPPEEAAIRAALESGEVSKPKVLNELTGPPIRLMDRSTNGWPFRLIGPVHTAVAEDQPLFQWERVAGAVSYTVSVFDDKFDRVMKSDPQSGTRWRAPIRLKRGQVYSWEITALQDGQQIRAPIAPAPRARFKVLRSAELKDLIEARGREPRSHLALGVTCVRMGLVNEAETEFNILVTQNPDSALARRLLAEVQSWRPH